MTGCGLPCPVPVYSDQEYSTVKKILNATNLTSLILLAFAMISWILIRGKLAFPANLLFLLFMSLIGIHFTMLFGLFHGGEDSVWCENSYTLSSQDHVICGAMLLYFGRSAMISWFNLLVNFFLGYCMNRTRAFQRSMLSVYIFWGFGYPFVPLLIALPLKKISYSVGSSWCFVTSDNSGAWQYGLFYGELIFLLLVGFYLSASILITLQRHALVVQKMQSKSRTVPNTHTPFRRKVIALLAWVFLQLLMLTVFRLDSSVHEGDIQASVKDWAKCLFSQYAVGGSEALCSMKTKPSFGLLATTVLLSGLDGVVVSLLFGFAEDVREFWTFLVLHLWNKYIRQKPNVEVDAELAKRSRFRLSEDWTMAKSKQSLRVIPSVVM
eukprot:c12092_g1_i1.p1 GENE.c12092_g1_i1~~c12092_g1_i1.p1  ORF type:complete len:381 (+),score=59.39 c12092_g1_i1:838-1980(+)